MTSEIQISQIDKLKEAAFGLGVSSFADAANVGSIVVFVTNQFHPLLFNVATGQSTLFQGKSKVEPMTMCIDISNDAQMVVTGHDDGSVFLWSIKDGCTLLKAHKKMHTSPICQIKFGEKSDGFYVSDCHGLTSFVSITMIFGIVGFSEKEIHDGKIPVQQLVVSRSDGPFPVGYIVFPTSYVIFNPRMKKGMVVFESKQFQNPPMVTLVGREQDYCVAIANGNKLAIMQMRSPDDKNVLKMGEFNGESRITAVMFLSTSLLVVISENGSMKLVGSNGQIVCSSAESALSGLTREMRTVMSYNEEVMFLTTHDLMSLAFESWESLIMKHASGKEWEAAFRRLSEVHLGLGDELIGIPTNPSVRRRSVERLATNVLTKYFASVLEGPSDQLAENVSKYAFIIATMELYHTIEHDIYDMFKGAGKLGVFFDGFMTELPMKQISLICTPCFVDKYIEFTIGSNMKQKAEERLCEIAFELAYVRKITEIARSHDMIDFARYLLVTYEDNYLVPCQLFFDHGRVLEFMKDVFDKSLDEAKMREAQCTLAVWLLVPDKDGQFHRLRAVFEADWQSAAGFTDKIMRLLPIQYTVEQALRYRHVVEAVLQIVDSVDYLVALPLMKLVLPLIPIREIPIGTRSLSHVVQWIFTSDEPPSMREAVLELFTATHPGIIPDTSLAQWCEAAGFVRAVTKLYVQSKQYLNIIASMILTAEGRGNIFEFIENQAKADPDEVLLAVTSHVRALLAIHPLRFVSFINRFYQSSHSDILDSLSPQLQMIYLNAYVDVVGASELGKRWTQLLFRLIMDYDPRTAAHFLTEHITELDLDEARNICERKKRVDCLVQIRIYHQQNREAVDEIGHEVERTLLDFIESDSNASPSNLDELADMEELKEPMDAIRVAIKLLESTKEDSDNAMQWQRVYMFFRFPIYRAAKKKDNIKNAVTMMFSYFFVTSLNTIQAHTAFLIMSIHFAGLDHQQYREVLSNVFRRIDYERNLFAGVEHMLVNDCLDLIDKVFAKETRGIGCQGIPHCGVCHEPIMKSLSKFKVYECGHCYHLTPECGEHTTCPICAGMGVRTRSACDASDVQKMTTRRMQQVMRRMDFALRKNFGEQKNSADAHAAVYFAEQERIEPLEQIDLSEMVPPPSEHTVVFDF